MDQNGIHTLVDKTGPSLSDRLDSLSTLILKSQISVGQLDLTESIVSMKNAQILLADIKKQVAELEK